MSQAQELDRTASTDAINREGLGVLYIAKDREAWRGYLWMTGYADALPLR